MATPPAQVTVVFDSRKKITVNPYKVQIFQDQQKIVWTLVSQIAGAHFTIPSDGDGIVIKKRGAIAPHKDWPGRPAIPGPGPLQYHADCNDPNTSSATAILYQYDIRVTSDGKTYSFSHGKAGDDDRSDAMGPYDPDISNEPQH